MPRFRLQTYTSTTPATPVAPTVRSVMLSGGALNPCARRRAVRRIEVSA